MKLFNINDKKQLQKLALSYDVKLTEQQIAKLFNYLEYLYEVNQTINLTAIKSKEDALVLNLLDSLLYQRALQGLEISSMISKRVHVDLGSGGGFPALPLNILNDWMTLCVESVGKKANFLCKTGKLLGLDLLVYKGRCEELPLDIQNGGCCSLENFLKVSQEQPLPSSTELVTARALDTLPVLLEYASPLLGVGGYACFSKGRNADEEIARANKVLDTLGFELMDSMVFELPLEYGTRKLILYKKTHEASIKLPRRIGKAHKSPLA